MKIKGIIWISRYGKKSNPENLIGKARGAKGVLVGI